MECGRIRRAGEGDVILSPVWRVGNRRERLRGLLGRPRLEAGAALLLTACGSVHTVGMGYALDLVFLDRRGRVVKQVHGLRPWRLSGAMGARETLEMRAGTLSATGIVVGDYLVWSET